MSSERVVHTAFDFLNTVRKATFRYLDVSQVRDPIGAPAPIDDVAHDASPIREGVDADGGAGDRRKVAFSPNSLWTIWRRPWPLTARVPIVSGALILAVAVAVSHALMSTVAYEQELGVRRLAAVYLDGISTTVYPHVVAHNLADTVEELHRTMWFHQSMREQRAMVRLPDGTLFADVSAKQDDANTEDPFHNPDLRRRLERGKS